MNEKKCFVGVPFASARHFSIDINQNYLTLVNLCGFFYHSVSNPKNSKLKLQALNVGTLKMFKLNINLKFGKRI